MQLRTVHVTRYLTPLREGGSLPAIVEGDDDGTYVLKFRGAGQGVRVLVAELIVGEMARILGFRMPELVLMELDPVLGRAEPDPEIQELIQASAGLNLALDYLPGSITFEPLVPKPMQQDSQLASEIVWLDAFCSNVDRTARNANMLIWHKHLWLIDHGAALFFHHNWQDYQARSLSPFSQIKDHVLLPFASASQLAQADAKLAPLLTPERLRAILDLIPDQWLGDVPAFESVEAHRQAYLDYFLSRLQGPRKFLEEAQHAHLQL